MVYAGQAQAGQAQAAQAAQAQAAQAAELAQQAAIGAEQAAREIAIDAQRVAEEALAQARVEMMAGAQGGGGSPSAIYEAQVAARREFQNQLRSLERQRDEIAREINRANQAGNTAAVPGLEARLKTVDARIAAVDARLTEANLAVARAASIPGAIQQTPPPRREGPPEEVFALGGLFMVVVLLPISIAYARRLWKRGSTIIAPVPSDVRERLDGLTQAVEAISVEVERIGEGQRFVTRVLTESRPVEHQLPIDRHVAIK